MRCIGVVGSEGVARAAAASFALRLAHGSAAGLISLSCEVEMRESDPELMSPANDAGIPPIAPPPVPSAARLSAHLRRNGHPGRATWRLVTSRVSDIEEARSVVELLGEEIDWPVVSICGPLSEDAIALLSECDFVVLALSACVPEGLAEIAFEPLGESGCRAAVEWFESPGLGAVLPMAGIAVPPVWTDPIARALDSLGLAA